MNSWFHLYLKYADFLRPTPSFHLLRPQFWSFLSFIFLIQSFRGDIDCLQNKSLFTSHYLQHFHSGPSHPPPHLDCCKASKLISFQPVKHSAFLTFPFPHTYPPQRDWMKLSKLESDHVSPVHTPIHPICFLFGPPEYSQNFGLGGPTGSSLHYPLPSSPPAAPRSLRSRQRAASVPGTSTASSHFKAFAPVPSTGAFFL